MWWLRIGSIFSVLIWLQCTSDRQALGSEGLHDLPRTVDYNFHIKPILSDRCFVCHGPDEAKREADLRLDTEEGPYAMLENGNRAIVRGKPGKSELIRRIYQADPELVMPPPESKLALTEVEKALLTKWIDQGAEYKEHWAYIPPRKEDFPAVLEKSWLSNEIDHFVLAKIEAAGLQPSSRASKEALIRRLTFDVIGLPPTLAEIDDFIEDTSSLAYENIIDRLLQSPHYGERMASDWLAVSRYGDTHGYEADSKRMAWPWRDWVIRAFNENMPYDQFIREQLAGDLLSNPTRDQLIATAFNRNHLMNSENGILDEEWRVEYVSDRTNTMGKALIGLTLECAKCHDHKYDPITQKEYFGMFAFFNNVDESGQIRYESQAAPVLDLTTEAQDRALEKWNQLSDELITAIADYTQQLKSNEHWKSLLQNRKIDLQNGLNVYVPFEEAVANKKGKILINQADERRPISLTGEPKFIAGKVGKALHYDGITETVIKDSKSSFASTDAFSHALWVTFPEPFTEARLLGTEDGSFDLVPGYYLFIDDEKLTFQLCSTWDYNYIKVTTEEAFPFKKWTHVAVTYDGSCRASGVRIYLDGKLQKVTIKKDNLSKNLNTQAWFKIGHTSFEGGAIDEYRQYQRVLSMPEVQTLAQLSPTEDGWFDFYLHQDEQLLKMRDSLRFGLNQRMSLLDTVPQLMIMKDLQDSVRPTYILNRGVYDDRGEQVDVHTPASLNPFSADFSPDRLGLTEWMFDAENPLSSRVMVNRIWQMLFGRGLVSTPDDFGSQGTLPSHPKLLDWLAVDFRENGWNIKALIKQILLTSTYQQASIISDELMQKDPNNELLARGVRFRLPAEMIRDNALAVSGLLSSQIGGEPVKPYQPADLWAQVSSTKIPYVQDRGQKLYRRSLYTYWKRAAPPPNMLTFDAPSRHTCTVTREATSTPLQALILLNDVQFMEAARVFAENLLREKSDQVEIIKQAFRICTARMPSSEEVKMLQKLWDQSKLEFENNPADAQKIIQVGEHPIEDLINGSEIAALTMITSAILNLNEVITKS